MNYSEFIDRAMQVLNVPADDPEFVNIIPAMIDETENRIYRDFDFLATLSSQTALLTSSARTIALPTNVIVCQSINVVTPSSTTNPNLGTRNPLTRVSLDWLNMVYPSTATAALPTKYAIVGSPTISTTITAGAYSILLGPAPDAAYTLEVIGTIRPSVLSPSNSSTFLTTNMPDLYLAAALVFGFGFQRDYGGKSDDPQAAMSWEATYKTLKDGISVEELRRKSASVSWSPYVPTPVANMQRERGASG